MDKSVLDEFGKIIIKRVRDQSILEWEMLIKGSAKGRTAKRVQDILAFEDDMQKLLALVPMIIDTSLHHILWTIEQEEQINVSIDTAHGRLSNIGESSDELAGELIDWISKFSTKPYKL